MILFVTESLQHMKYLHSPLNYINKQVQPFYLLSPMPVPRSDSLPHPGPSSNSPILQLGTINKIKPMNQHQVDDSVQKNLKMVVQVVERIQRKLLRVAFRNLVLYEEEEEPTDFFFHYDKQRESVQSLSQILSDKIKYLLMKGFFEIKQGRKAKKSAISPSRHILLGTSLNKTLFSSSCSQQNPEKSPCMSKLDSNMQLSGLRPAKKRLEFFNVSKTVAKKKGNYSFKAKGMINCESMTTIPSVE